MFNKVVLIDPNLCEISVGIYSFRLKSGSDFYAQGVCEETIERCLYASTYVSNGCQIQQIFEKVVLKDHFMLKYCQN